MERRDLTVASGGVCLAGSIWLPNDRPDATVYMHPGSGPSDRDNDVFFPPIRKHLLASGLAVCSFDKRGGGGSTGRWEDAGIVEQADDALAAVSVLLNEPGPPIGLLGHSQGGWVVVEAAARGAPISFVVASSGPGVTPAAQERYSALTHLRERGLSQERVDDAMAGFDLLVSLMRERVPFDEARTRIEAVGAGSVYDELDLPFVPNDEAVWNFACSMIDYDPRQALDRIQVPVLAVFGAEDQIVPVDESVAAYRHHVRPDLLTVSVVAHADHRMQVGDPPRTAAAYLETLSSFVSAVVA